MCGGKMNRIVETVDADPHGRPPVWMKPTQGADRQKFLSYPLEIYLQAIGEEKRKLVLDAWDD